MRNYKIIVHRDEVSGFWAEVPELPGCVSQGETRDELQKNIHEAIEGYLEVMAMDGGHPEEVEFLEVAV
jgi:predicted RNase H-like HicB family nuclease